MIIGIVLAVAVVAVGGFLVISGQKSAAPTQPAVTQQTPAVVQTTNAVTIQNFAFSPATLTVPAGTTVTWTNQDSAPHQIKSDTFNSAQLSQGESYQFTFTTKGSFDYSCAIHPSMTGKINVE